MFIDRKSQIILEWKRILAWENRFRASNYKQVHNLLYTSCLRALLSARFLMKHQDRGSKLHIV